MGNKIGNTFVRCDRQEKVIEAVRHLLPRLAKDAGAWPLMRQDVPAELLDVIDRLRAPQSPAAYVSPPRNGWVGVFEESLEGATDLAPQLAVALSQELETVALSFHIWDGDYLSYCLAQNGHLMDEFSQNPDVRYERPGQPAILARVCGCPEAEQALARHLGARSADALDTLTAVAGELGIDDPALSYRYCDTEGSYPLADLAGYITVTRESLIGDRDYRSAVVPPRSAIPAGPPNLPLEPVETDIPAGYLAYGGLTLEVIKANIGQAAFIKYLLWYLHDTKNIADCTIWTDAAPMHPPDLWHVYISAPDGAARAAFLDELIGTGFRPAESTHTCVLPGDALPVAKRTADGTIIRLWPSPGPKVSPKQRVKVEWRTLTVLNRCFDLRRPSSSGASGDSA